MKRPATLERIATSLRRRATSLAETSPYRRTTASTLEEEAAPSEFGPYLVYEKLGEGGMAVVHRAELVAASGLRKQVALKRLHTEASEDPDLVTAFVHEAQLAARLHHPNIAQAYELGKIDNTYFIAMELVPGPTLSQVMTQVRNGAGAVPLPIALEILIQISDALDQVHNLRDETGSPLDLIHRDVSPTNIIISRTGAAKLIDFGIAKVRSGRHATEAGIIKGKHGYVAPEYTYGHLDHRADLFALGVVAHELLTGRRLFLGDTELETIANVRHLAISPPSRHAPGLSRELDRIVLTALEREPGLRWQSAGAMRSALVEEVRRLGVVISGPQIRDWVEWAFQQNARRDSSIDRLTNGLDPSVSIVIEIEEPRARTPQPVRAPTPQPARATTPPAIDSSEPPLLPTAEFVRATPVRPPSAQPMRATPTPARIASSMVQPSALPTSESPSTPLPERLRAPSAQPMRAPTLQSAGAPTLQSAGAPWSQASRMPALDSSGARPSEGLGEPPLPARARTPLPLPAPSSFPARSSTLPPGVAPTPLPLPAPAPYTARSSTLPPGVAPVPQLAAAFASPPAAAFSPPPAVGATPAAFAPPPVAPFVAQPIVPAAPQRKHARARAKPRTAGSRSRAPHWRAPTRWQRPPRRSVAPVVVLLALIAFAFLAIDQGWIDLDRWREILSA